MAEPAYTPSEATIFWIDRTRYPRWMPVAIVGGASALLGLIACFDPIAVLPALSIVGMLASAWALRGYFIPVAVALEEHALVVVRERVWTPRPKRIGIALDDIVCVSRNRHMGHEIGLLVHTRSLGRIPLDLARAAYRIQLNRSDLEGNDHQSPLDTFRLLLHGRGIAIGRPPVLLARLTGDRAHVHAEPHAAIEPFIAPRWLTLLQLSALVAVILALASTFGIPRLGASRPSSQASYALNRAGGRVYVSETLGRVHSAAPPVSFAWWFVTIAVDLRVRRAHRRRGSS